MTASPDTSDPLDLRLLWAAGYRTVEHLPETGSTMDRGRALALERRAAVPAVVIADRQTSGRGRRGARWWQAAGSLAASLVLDPAATAAGSVAPPTWSLACGVAVAETVAALAGVDARLRWPNDVELAGRKLAGILVEAAAGGRVVVGIGVNTSGTAADAPAAIRAAVATLPDATGRPLARGAFLAALLPRLEPLLVAATRQPESLVARYRSLCGLTGRTVTLHVDGTSRVGVCRGIAADGSLVLDTATGTERFLAGSLTAPAAVWRGEPEV